MAMKGKLLCQIKQKKLKDFTDKLDIINFPKNK